MTTKKTFNLDAVLRKETGKAVQDLRTAGKIPAVLYGHGVENQNLTLDLHKFEKILDEAGESTLIDLKIGNNEPVKIIIQDVARDSISHKIIHADFYQVNMNEEITTDVELVFVNESSAVKDLSGSLVKALDKVEIKCLPGDLISHINVDLSTLATFDDIIRVEDLKVSEAVEILTDASTTIALVEEPKTAEQIAAEEAEMVGEEEKLAEEGEEGETKEGEESEAEKETGAEEKKEEAQETPQENK